MGARERADIGVLDHADHALVISETDPERGRLGGNAVRRFAIQPKDEIGRRGAAMERAVERVVGRVPGDGLADLAIAHRVVDERVVADDVETLELDPVAWEGAVGPVIAAKDAAVSTASGRDSSAPAKQLLMSQRSKQRRRSRCQTTQDSDCLSSTATMLCRSMV